MAATTILRRLLLPAVKSKKTLEQPVLLTKNWNCVTSQFYQISYGQGALAKKNTNVPIVKPAKEKKSGRKIRSTLTNDLMPSKAATIKTIDIPVHFQRSEEIFTLPTYLPGYKFIKKDQIEKVTKGFKQTQSPFHFYIMPNGVMSTLAKDKESYEYKVTRRYYIDESDAKKKLSVINVECKKPDLKHSNFKKYSLIHHYSVKSKEEPIEVPDVTKNCIRTVEPVEALEKTLKWFAVRATRFTLITKNDKEEYVKTDVENDNAVARIQTYEYNHTNDNNIVAIYKQVTAFSGAKELKKLENLGFLQVFSKEKQILIFIDKILAKMKTLEESDGGDFSVRALKEDIEKDESLKEVHRNKYIDKYQKVNKSFKHYSHLKVRPSQPDLECQKYHFVSTQKPITDYHVWQILKTTDKELKPFIGKCLVQKMEKIHQTITIPDDVFKFMLANEPTTVQPSNQEVLSHFKSIDCLVEAKAQSSSKEKKNSSRSNRKKLTVNNDETANKEPCTTNSVKNEEDTINGPKKSVGLEKDFPMFDKPGLKSFLLTTYYKQMSRSKIYAHPALKFSQDDFQKTMETIENNPETQFCSQITKVELATYLLMKQHKFDKESAA